MQTDLQPILIGALAALVVALVAAWFAFHLTQTQAEKDRKEEFHTLLILLSWQVQKIAAQATQAASPLELQMPAYGMLITRGLFARLPTQLRDHLLCLEIGLEGANRANALIEKGPGPLIPPRATLVLAAMRADVERYLVAVRKEVAEVLAALDQLFKRLHIESKPITYSVSAKTADDSDQEPVGDKQSDKP
jgi:hypothetical protein